MKPTAPCLNPTALSLIASALADAASVYRKIAEDSTLPPHLSAQFSTQAHMADVLQQLFEEQPEVSFPQADRAEYKARIWES